MICGAPCAEQNSFTKGFSRTKALEIGAKIGAKLDYFLPGLSAGIAGKRSTTLSESTQKTTTHTCTARVPQCDGLNHTEYQLIERYTFEYRGGLFGNTLRVDSIESEENIFDLSTYGYRFPGCRQTQDDRHAQLQAQGYTQCRP